MSQLEEDEEHADLRQLFADTADEAARPVLTKLAARAADIPERARGKSSFFPRWAWTAGLASAAAALGALLALRVAPGHAVQRAPELASAAPIASMALASASMALASASAREVKTGIPRSSSSSGTSDEASEGPELLGEADEGARFDVAGPQSDRDLDAWLAATKELSGGS